MNKRLILRTRCVEVGYALFLAAAFLAAVTFWAGLFVTGLLLPNDPLKRFPLAVFLSPLPIIVDFNSKIFLRNYPVKKTPSRM